MDSNKLKQAAVLGGITAALTDAIPYLNLINCLCCLGLAAGGVVAVLFMYSSDDEKHIYSLPELIQIGLWTGIAGALFAFVFHYIMFQILGNWQVQWISNMIENMEDVPPMWEEIYQELQSPEMQGFAGMAVLVRSLILFPIFTFLGALFTNRVLERKQG